MGQEEVAVSSGGVVCRSCLGLQALVGVMGPLSRFSGGL